MKKLSQVTVDAFFDELTKISANFGFLGPTAQNYAGMLKRLKAGAGTAAESAAFRVQNQVKAVRAARARSGLAPAAVTALQAQRPPVRPAPQTPARRYVSEGTGAVASPQTGRAQFLLDQMRKRVNPALASPQVAAAQKAEQQARTGALQQRPVLKVM